MSTGSGSSLGLVLLPNQRSGLFVSDRVTLSLGCGLYFFNVKHPLIDILVSDVSEVQIRRVAGQRGNVCIRVDKITMLGQRSGSFVAAGVLRVVLGVE